MPVRKSSSPTTTPPRPGTATARTAVTSKKPPQPANRYILGQILRPNPSGRSSLLMEPLPTSTISIPISSCNVPLCQLMVSCHYRQTVHAQVVRIKMFYQRRLRWKGTLEGEREKKKIHTVHGNSCTPQSPRRDHDLLVYLPI